MPPLQEVIRRQRRKDCVSEQKPNMLELLQRALATYLNGTVSNTAESPVGSRPLCEDRPNIVRQLYFPKIAVRSAIRSTLLTAERLAAARFMQASKKQACLGFATSAAKARQRQWEGRTSYIACKAIHEQEEWAKVYANERVETCLHTKRVQLNLDAVNGAPECRVLWYFLTYRKYKA